MSCGQTVSIEGGDTR